MGGGVACQQPTEPEAPVEPTKYTITFDSQGGSEVAAREVKENVAATAPEAPTKDGYTFGGWLNGEAAYDWTQPVTSNLSLTAKWTATQYTITYLPDGVEKDTYIKSYTIESDAIVLDTNPTSPDATKPNFVAWHVDSEEGAVVTEIAKGSTGNKTFYAEFSAEEPCVVKFMLGTKEEASTKVKKGNKITLPTGFEKYSLFSDADCTKPFDTNTAITADTTIYVKLKTFTISYKVLPFNEEGSMPAEYGKVITEEEINAFAVEIDGYTYKGIFTDEACTAPFDNTNAIKSDLTVYVLYEESINPVLWEGEEAVSTGNWAAGVSIDAKNFAGLTSGYALKVTYNDDSDSTTYKYHQFGFTSAPEGENTKLEGVDVTLNDYGCFELPAGGTYCYHPLSEKDITSLKTNGLYIGGYGVVISKVELKKYTNIVIDSSKNYTCFGGGEGELTTATPITISEDLGIGKPFSYETVLKIVDTKSYSNGGVIFDFEIPEGKSLADYSIEGLFYFPRVGDDDVGYDDSMYYKNVCLYAGTTLTENGYMEALASVSTVWDSNNAWKSFAPIAADGKEESLAALKGNVQFAIGMNSDKGTYYLAKVTIYEK